MNKTETNDVFSDKERLDRLRLLRTVGIGPVTFRALLKRFTTAGAAIEGAREIAKANGRKKPLYVPGRHRCEQELESASAFGAAAVFLGEPHYPAMLAATEDAPPMLFTKGNMALAETRAVGIVGARNASAAGLKLTRTIAAEIADAGFAVTSGLARGIDTAAHHAAQPHRTIACIAGGLDVAYPAENESLQQAIAANGLVVTEMPFGTQPQARHFPRRNRLISGFSEGVLVVEAAVRSGSLITARFAADQGRDVFAVPGSPLDPRARGGNSLIKDGAMLVENAQDILAALPASSPVALPESPPIRLARTQPLPARTAIEVIHAESSVPKVTPREAESLLNLLSTTPVHTDDIVRQTGASTTEVMSAFLELELAGKIARHSGGKVSRIYDE